MYNSTPPTKRAAKAKSKLSRPWKQHGSKRNHECGGAADHQIAARKSAASQRAHEVHMRQLAMDAWARRMVM